MADEPEPEEAAGRKSKRRRVVKDTEYGVSRGVDFQGVKNVVNFDFPRTAKGYMHRVGRLD